MKILGGKGGGFSAAQGIRKVPAAALWIALLVLVLLADFSFTGIWALQESEQGVVLRFGKAVRKAYPGLVFTLPYPFETVAVVNIKETLKMPVGFRFAEGADPSPASTDESEWLTGDTNVIDVEMMIHYNISDPYDYLFRAGRFTADFLIRKCAESVLTETVGVMCVDSILTTEKMKIENRVREKTQALLDRFGAGVRIARASLQKVAPPVEVNAAFQDVSSAKADRERALQEADSYLRDLLPTARYLAAQIEQQALAQESAVLSEAKGRTESFKALCAEYKNAPEITRTRLFLDAMEKILSEPRKIVAPRAGEGESKVRVLR